jgi:hypothetical protein
MTTYAKPSRLKLTGASDFDRAVEITPRGAMGPSVGPSTCGECQHWDRNNKRKRTLHGLLAVCLKRLAWDRGRGIKTRPEAVPEGTPSCTHFVRRAGPTAARSRADRPTTLSLFGDSNEKRRPGAV